VSSVAAILVLSLFTGLVTAADSPPTSTVPAGGLHWGAGADWTTYLDNVERTGSTAEPDDLNVANAPNLTEVWNFSASLGFYAEPAIVGGIAYVGGWSGYEYALNLANGSMIWETYLGQDPTCGNDRGISSSATVLDGTVYVGGGNGSWYALNATNGAVDWSVFIGNTSAGYYNWASPLIYDGYAFVGVASKCINPFIPGALVQVNITNHSVARVFNTTNGTLGSSIWSSPAVDPATNTVYVTTGSPIYDIPTQYSEAILALNATTLAVQSYWAVPPRQIVADGDFGATPTLYPASTDLPYISAINKNGVLYTWNRSNLSAGPVWHHSLGIGGIAPAAIGDDRIYAGASTVTIHGTTYNGSLAALALRTGRILWQIPEPQRLFGAPVAHGKLVFVGDGPTFSALNGANGATLYHFNITGGSFWGAASISRGIVVVGATNGYLYAFAVAGQNGHSASLRGGLLTELVATFRRAAGVAA
jgi:outer membrane protein assembly factor BamB